MNLSQVEAFLVVSEELHFGRSADRLVLSQSRVSRLVASLEREVGGALFERTSRRVCLTPLGANLRKQLLPAHTQLLAAFEEARATARATRGALRIGLLATTDGPSITQLVETFHAVHPSVDVSLHEIVEIFDPYGALRRGEVDVLVSWLAVDEPDLTAGPAIEHRDRVLAVAPGHRLAKRESVSVDDLGDEEVARLLPTFPGALYDALIPPRTPSGQSVRRTLLCRTFHEILSQVARGHIVHPTVVSMSLLKRDDIALIPIRDLPPLPLGLIWRSAHQSVETQALADVARSLGKKGQGERVR